MFYFGQTFKNLGRVRQILRVLIKYGFEELVVSSGLYQLLPENRQLNWLREDRSVLDYTFFERVRMAVEELGPTFIKGAQVLGNRPDLLPMELIEEFQKLQSAVPPFDVALARQIIERELGKPIGDIFSRFDDVPIGSASIGQVHRARLLNGDEVVIKVQRPRIRRIIQTDLSILKEIANRGESFFERQGFTNLTILVEAFEKSMLKELDYRLEGKSIEQFREFYANFKGLYIPRAYREYTSERVMVIEFAKGCKITDVKQLRAWGLNPADIAELGMHIYLSQIFEHGYFHADPHPGNILVRQDGTVCLIDFGMVGKLSQRDKFAFASVLVGMAQRNPGMAAAALRRLAIEDDIQDYRVFEYDMGEIIEEFGSVDVSESNMAESAMRLQKLIYDNKMKVPGSVFLLLRAMTILEGIGKEIHPHFMIYDFVRPYGAKLLKEQLAPEYLAQEAYHIGSEFWSFLTGFPVEIKDILRKLRRGTIQIELKHKGHMPAVHAITNAVHRFALMMMAAVLLLVGAIIEHGDAAGVHRWQALFFIGVGVLLGIFTFFSVVRSFRDGT